MPLPEWNLDTSFAEKLQMLRHAVDHLLGDDVPPMFKDPPPEEIERRQREAGTYVAASDATPQEVQRAVAVLEAYNRQQSQPLGASPSQPQQLQPEPTQAASTPAPVQSAGFAVNPPENAPTGQSESPASDAPANNVARGDSPIAEPGAAVEQNQPPPPPARQAWNPNPLPSNSEGSNR